jgi:hypothetical protein
MLETQIQQISVALPSQSNGDSYKMPVQESVRSIFTVFKEKAPKSTEGSLGGVSKDKKPSAAKDFSMKFSRHVKNATPAVTSSPAHRQPKSSGMETVLLTDLKCDALAGRTNR